MNEISNDTPDPQDVQGRELPDIEPAPPAPAPTTSTRTKIFVVIFAVIVLGGGLIGLLSALSGPSAPAEPPSTVDVDAASTETAAERSMQSGADDIGIPLPGVSTSPPTRGVEVEIAPTRRADLDNSRPSNAPIGQQDLSPRIERLKADLQARIQAFGEQVDDLMKQVRQSKERVDQLDGALKQLEDRVATGLSQQPTTTADQVKQLQQTAAKLSAKLNAIDRRSRANTRRLSGEAGARWQGQRLPFEVESVDWWGASPSVAVRRGGRRDFFAPGETVAGWKLVSVDAASRTVRFERNGIQALARVAQ